jgi:anti-sigma factor RsiW
MTSHLGDRLTALVDGELGHDARDRALSHIAFCPACRAALEAERGTKHLVASTPTPPPPADLHRRLRALAEPGEPLPPRRTAMPGGASGPRSLPLPDRSPAGRRPAASRTHARPGGRRPGQRRAVRAGVATLGALSAVGVALAAAFVLGGPQASGSGSPLLPPVEQFSVEHAVTEQMPLADPAVGAVTATFGEVSFDRGSLSR